MRSGLDLELIFPIKDEPSAHLMRLEGGVPFGCARDRRERRRRGVPARSRAR
jgi:hypothetical protein